MTKRATRTAAAMSLALMMLIGANCFAVVPYFNAAGSSGAFNSFALAAGPAEGGGICGGFIWTKKNGAEGVDHRGTGLLEAGNVWIVWDNSAAPKRVCSYIAVDSIIGQQLFFAEPASTFNILFPAGTAGDNLIPTLTDTAIPQSVINVLQGQAFNAAPSDIRPEDALFEETRVLTPLNTTNYDGLGYGPGPVGSPILSHFSTKSSTPALYALSGTDPITGQAVPAHHTINVGTQVVVVIVNAQQGSNQNSGHFGDSTSFFNVNRRDLTLALNGGYAYTKDLTSVPGQASVPLNVITREPLSGTFTTMEFNIPRNAETGSTQELGVNPATGQGTTCPGQPCGNPLNLSDGGGSRWRAIGNGEEVAEIDSSATGDSIGYAFWSVGNLGGLSPNFRYLAVDGNDPINLSYVDGTLPTCTAPCPGIVTFANVASGNYPIWNILRVVTHNPVPGGVTALVAGAQSQVVNVYPDFLPLSAMGVFRSHYRQSLISALNGTGGACSPNDTGGDVGGAVLTIQSDQDYCAATGIKAGRVGLKQ
ncbi:MAG: hypothetical protein WB711_21350 [Terriglobales bacterium]